MGLCEFFWIGKDNLFNEYTFMSMELLGPSLFDLFICCGYKFSLKTVLMIADQCISSLEYLHYNKFIH